MMNKSRQRSIMLHEQVNFQESEVCWEKGGHRRGVWSETGYLCLVLSAKLHLPVLPWTSFQEMLQPE